MIRPLSTLACICLALAASSCSLSLPGSGGPSAIIIYAATSAGVSVSLTGGSSWISQGLASYTVKGIVAVSAGTYITEYAATSNGIYVSTDGSTWPTNHLSGSQVNGIVVSGTYIYAAPGSGLCISADRGASWSSANPAVSLTGVFVVGFGATATIFASAAGGPNGLYVSPDGGTTWSSYNTAGGLPSNNVYSVFDDGTNAYIGTDAGLFQTLNTTLSSWSISYNNTVAGFSSSNTVNGLFFYGTTIYACTGSGLSVGSGSLWTTYLSGVSVNGVSVSGTDIYASTSTGAWISLNGGVSWTQGLAGTTVYGLAIQ
jgi:hypothetical protein